MSVNQHSLDEVVLAYIETWSTPDAAVRRELLEISLADDGTYTDPAYQVRGKEELAISRDEGGQTHLLSAKCTHEGCTVHWNPFEQCWDCPCHGSQFAPDGTALNAPAVAPLEAAQAPAGKKEAQESASH